MNPIIVSEDTLRLDHVTKACLRWLNSNSPSTAARLYKSIPKNAISELTTTPDVLDPDSWWRQDEAREWLDDTLMEAMDDAAPDGVTFGAHPNDPACFGYWPFDWEATQQLAQEALNSMMPNRSGELLPNAPGWVQELMRMTRGGFPDDRYATKSCVNILERIVDAANEDAVYAAVYDGADIYNADLLKWLTDGDSMQHIEYVDDVLKERNTSGGLMAVIQQAQISYLHDLTDQVLAFLQEQLD